MKIRPVFTGFLFIPLLSLSVGAETVCERELNSAAFQTQWAGYSCRCPCPNCAAVCTPPAAKSSGSSTAYVPPVSGTSTDAMIAGGVAAVATSVIADEILSWFGGGSQQSPEEARKQDQIAQEIQNKQQYVFAVEKQTNEMHNKMAVITDRVYKDFGYEIFNTIKVPEASLGRIHVVDPDEQSVNPDTFRSPAKVFDTSVFSQLQRLACSQRLNQNAAKTGDPELARLYSEQADMASQGQFIVLPCLTAKVDAQ